MPEKHASMKRARPAGGWNGVFGRLGVLAYDPDEDRVQGYLCGEFFRFLAARTGVVSSVRFGR